MATVLKNMKNYTDYVTTLIYILTFIVPLCELLNMPLGLSEDFYCMFAEPKVTE